MGRLSDNLFYAREQKHGDGPFVSVPMSHIIGCICAIQGTILAMILLKKQLFLRAAALPDAAERLSIALSK